ncbi:MAG: phosphatase PAP2 family protein [Methanobrevibacter sp.]|nr:phosphatase PAP2 family protein [Candidatus Methanovirga procula]
MALNIDLFYFLNHGIHNNILNSFIPCFTNYINDSLIWSLFILLFLYSLIFKKKNIQRISTYLILSGLICSFIVIYLKFSINEPRPFDVLNNVHQLTSEKLSSFPSGHSAAGFVLATVFSLTYKIKIKRFNFNSGWILYPLGILMGISRVYVGVHYPLDIFVGAIVGILSSYFIVKLGDKN